MKLSLGAQVLALTWILAVPICPGAAAAVSINADCNFCHRKCYDDAGCELLKEMCLGAANMFQSVSLDASSACVEDKAFISGPQLLQEAKDWLVCKNFYTNWEVDWPSYTFCRAPEQEVGVSRSTSKIGFVPISEEKNNVLLYGDWQDVTPITDIAQSISYELVHCDQLRRWGKEGYECRITQEAMNGHDSMDQECQNFATLVAACVLNSAFCPGDCPLVSTKVECSFAATAILAGGLTLIAWLMRHFVELALP